MSRVLYVLDYIKYLKNPISCLLFKFGHKKEVTVKFRKSNEKIKVTQEKTMNKIIDSLISQNYTVEEFLPFYKDVESKQEFITTINNIKIYNYYNHPLNLVFAEYYSDYYSHFNINFKNRTIIDIGANAGDSTLYFASEGAKVYSYEPVKEYYDMALKNIKLNPNLENKIEIFNCGVSNKRGTINIGKMNSVSNYIDENDTYEVEIVSLDDILNNVEADLLKMDCEGCEFDIIENCDMSKFNELIFEYHPRAVNKDYKILIKKLEEDGFEIVNIIPAFRSKIEDLGIIHAIKKQ